MFQNSSKHPLLFAVCDQFKLFILEIFSKSVRNPIESSRKGVSKRNQMYRLNIFEVLTNSALASCFIFVGIFSSTMAVSDLIVIVTLFVFISVLFVAGQQFCLQALNDIKWILYRIVVFITVLNEIIILILLFIDSLENGMHATLSFISGF